MSRAAGEEACRFREPLSLQERRAELVPRTPNDARAYHDRDLFDQPRILELKEADNFSSPARTLRKVESMSAEETKPIRGNHADVQCYVRNSSNTVRQGRRRAVRVPALRSGWTSSPAATGLFHREPGQMGSQGDERLSLNDGYPIFSWFAL